jgi:hypothetical protein
MELTDPVGRRALAYVAALEASGYRPAEEDFEEYARRPFRGEGRSIADSAYLVSQITALTIRTRGESIQPG